MWEDRQVCPEHFVFAQHRLAEGLTANRQPFIPSSPDFASGRIEGPATGPGGAATRLRLGLGPWRRLLDHGRVGLRASVVGARL